MGSPFPGRLCGGIAVILFGAMLLTGCATRGQNDAAPSTGAGNQAAKLGTEIHRGKYSFIRIERTEAEAAGNEPRALDAMQLRNALATLKGKRNSFAGKPLFTAKELAELVRPLTTALGKANPGEDVVFAITGAHGSLGLLQSQSVTTGRAFIKDGKLNVIFGLAQVNFEDELLGNHTLRPFTPGSRKGIVHADTRIEGLSWIEPVQARSDWLAISVDALAAKAPTEVAPAKDGSIGGAPSPSGAAEEDKEVDRVGAVERRLEVLERLKQRGLITDEEYRDKRRVILMDL